MNFPPLPSPKMGRELWLQVLGVLAPGFLLLFEIVVSAEPHALSMLASRQLNGLITALSLVLAAVLSYALGLLCRAAGFYLARQMAKLRRHTPWRITPAEALENVERYFSRDGIAQALHALPLTNTPAADIQKGLLGGYHDYARFWLRVFAPSASVDRFEMEVNARLSFAVPIALGGVPVARLLEISTVGGSSWLTLALSAVMASLGLFVLAQGLEARKWERRDSLMHYVAVWHVLKNPPGKAPAAEATELDGGHNGSIDAT